MNKNLPPEGFTKNSGSLTPASHPLCLFYLLQDLIMLSVHTGTYDARSRALIRDVTGLLRLPWVQGELFENQLAHYLRGMYVRGQQFGVHTLDSWH